jgi:hydroxypyruvate isomerase
MKTINAVLTNQTNKKLGRTETAKLLHKLTSDSSSLNSLNEVQLDKREAAAYLEKVAKTMRFVALNAKFHSIQILVEEIYYHAYEESFLKERNDYRNFREMIAQPNN